MIATGRNIRLGLFFLTACLVPLAISAALGIVDPFLHAKIGSSITIVETGTLDFSDEDFKYTPGVGILIAVVSGASGMTPEVLEYVPIAGVMFIFAGCAVARKITGETHLAWLVACILVYRWVSPMLYSVWPHAFGYIFFLAFVSLFLSYLKSKRANILVAMIAVFVGIHLYSYNAELWAISVMVIAVLLFRTSYRSLSKDSWMRSLSICSGRGAYLALGFIVVFVSFSQGVMSSYVPKLELMAGRTSSSLSYYFLAMFRRVQTDTYLYVPEPSPEYVLVSNLSWYILVIVPLAIFILYLLARRVTSVFPDGINRDKALLILFSLSLLAVWFVDMASYVPIGAVAVAVTRYFVFISPVLSFLYLGWIVTGRFAVKRRRALRMVNAYAILVLILSVTIFIGGISSDSHVTSHQKYSEIETSAHWYFAYADRTQVYSDHNTQGLYSIVAARLGLEFDASNFYTLESFQHLFGQPSGSSEDYFYANSYVVVNYVLSYKKTTAGGWVDLEPLVDHIPSICDNMNLNLAYNDGYAGIFVGA